MSTIEQTRQTLPKGRWSADPVHSNIGFAIDYMAGSFQGTFAKFEAQIEGGKLRGKAHVPSIQVKDDNLEAHLQSPDFFDAERNPELAFEAHDIARSGDDLTISGELTMKGHTEPVDIRGRISDPMQDPFGSERFGLQLEAKVDRTAYGISWNTPLPGGKPALANEVRSVGELAVVKA